MQVFLLPGIPLGFGANSLRFNRNEVQSVGAAIENEISECALLLVWVSFCLMGSTIFSNREIYERNYGLIVLLFSPV